MVGIQGLLQDFAKLSQDEGQLVQDLAGGKLSELLDNAGGNNSAIGRWSHHHGGSSGSGNTGGSGNSGGANNNQGVSGSGTIWGDPHFTDSNGNQNYSVQGQAGDTYNLLSDTGIEVNGTFQQYSPGFNAVGEVGVNLNGDHIDIKPGQLTINGQQIDTSKPGSYLNGAVTVNKDGSITVKNDHYTLNFTTQSGGDSGKYLDTSITATNAGRQQQVGGLWGQSLEGKQDTNASDFQVSSLYSHQHGNGGNGGGSGGGFGGITIPNLTPPTLPANATTQQTLQFEQQMFQYATSVSALTTELNSLGNALKDASSKVAQ